MTVLLDRFLHNAQTVIPSPHSKQKQCPQVDITWSGARSKQTQQASFDMPALIKVSRLPPGWCWAAAGIAAGAGGPAGGLAAGSLALGVGESCLRTGRVLVAAMPWAVLRFYQPWHMALLLVVASQLVTCQPAPHGPHSHLYWRLVPFVAAMRNLLPLAVTIAAFCLFRIYVRRLSRTNDDCRDVR